MATLSCVIDLALESILRQGSLAKGFHTAKTHCGHRPIEFAVMHNDALTANVVGFGHST
jgi:hypothetical protein